MNVVDPIFGRSSANSQSNCGCTCTQTIPDAPSFNSVWTGQRDTGGGCRCTCNTIKLQSDAKQWSVSKQFKGLLQKR